MEDVRPQGYNNHRRWFPLYHFVAVPILLFNVIFAIWHAIRIPTTWNMWTAVVSIALLLLALAARTMACRAQDRVIRLEMRLRLKDVLSGPLAARIGELHPKHFVGLRFASDAELPALVERCLSGELANDEAVKKQIKNWQPDWLRV